MKKIKVREIIALFIILSLVIFTFIHPVHFACKFKDVVTVVLTYYFVTNEKQKEPGSPYPIRKGNNRIRGVYNL